MQWDPMWGFQFLLILDLWGLSFHAVIVFGLGKNLLSKSVLGHCVVIWNNSWRMEKLSEFNSPIQTTKRDDKSFFFTRFSLWEKGNLSSLDASNHDIAFCSTKRKLERG